MRQGRDRRLDSHVIPQRALKRQTPIQALKQWQLGEPELFRKMGLWTNGTRHLGFCAQKQGIGRAPSRVITASCRHCSSASGSGSKSIQNCC